MELVSLLEEQLPDYQLRVDSLRLYENPEWIQPPACHGRPLEMASPAHEEDSFRYMSELVFFSPNTENKNVDTQLILILGNAQIWKTLGEKAEFQGSACSSGLQF